MKPTPGIQAGQAGWRYYRSAISAGRFWAILSALALGLGGELTGTSGTSAETNVFDVHEFGAKGDGQTFDTTAIQKAVDKCGKSGGIVRFFPGAYLSKPIKLRSKVTLQLDEGAKLQATAAPEDFAKNGSPNSVLAFITGKDLQDVAITGKGVIDGAGASWWAAAREAKQQGAGSSRPRPKLILLTGCKHVSISGVTLQNSPSPNFVPTDCDDVLVERVVVKAPVDAPGTDGIVPTMSRMVTIRQCLIDVGGDNVAVKSFKPVSGHTFASEGVTVTNCAFQHGQGLAIGNDTLGGVRNVTVANCTFDGTGHGIRLKATRSRGGIAENILCENLTMMNVKSAVVITCYDGTAPTNDPPQRVVSGTSIFRNIQIKGLTARTLDRAGAILGLPESEVKDVLLENVQVSAETTGWETRNAKGVQLKNVRVTPKQGNPFVVEENAEIKGLEQARK